MSQCHTSLVPSPFSWGKKRTSTLCMCKIFLEFRETVFFIIKLCILNAIWRWSSIALACGCGYTRELWRLLLKSVSVLCYCLLLGLSHISLKKEQRSAILAVLYPAEVGCVSQQGTMERVCVTSVLPVYTFPDGLQALGRWGRMY